jgi:hypothetical protein
VEKLDLFIFPLVNPDGRDHSMNVYAMWRKNRRPEPPGVTCSFRKGVDLNRNYDHLWNFPTYFAPTAVVVSSTDPCDPSQTYIGPGAASEPETQNVLWLFDNHPNIRFLVDVHSFGKKVLYNWGDDENQSTDPNMNFLNPAYNAARGIGGDTAYREYISDCDLNLQIQLANRLRDGIQAVRGEAYTVQSSFALYATSGTSIDYAFSRHFVNRARGKVYGYCIEWGQEFQPLYTEMSNVIQDVTSGLLEFFLGILTLHADTFMKDNPADVGTVPVGAPFWHSPDLIVRQNDDGIFADEPAQKGQQNYIYVKVRNNGPAAAQNVQVKVRAVRFPGTEFVYPNDWTAIDATHLEPTVILNSFPTLAPTSETIAKFRLSVSQVNTLWGWQSAGWHPCLLAEVETCNDFGSPVGVHVWENNNLAQRNVTIMSALAAQTILFSFAYGNAFNADEQVTLEFVKQGFAPDMELTVDFLPKTLPLANIPEMVRLDEPVRVTPLPPHVPGEAPTIPRPEPQGCLALIRRIFGGGAARRKLDEVIKPVSGGQMIQREGRTLVALREAQASVQINRHPGRMHQALLSFRVPENASPGDVYQVDIVQRNADGQIAGGVALEVHITA